MYLSQCVLASRRSGQRWRAESRNGRRRGQGTFNGFNLWVSSLISEHSSGLLQIEHDTTTDPYKLVDCPM